MRCRSSVSGLKRHLTTLSTVGTLGGWTDGELLERFLAGRGKSAELAFAGLVERHGPMVLRVCRNVLGDSDDAQDAFQATFLVLVRRAPSVRNRESAASWLHGVALRVSGRALSDAARRRKHETRYARRRPQGHDEVECESWPELHEEIARLPEKYRAAIVLCHLEGRTAEEAARALGCPRGTVLSRLARGRERLRDRLTRRGLAPAAGTPALLLVPGTSRAVPEALVHETVRAALRAASGDLAAMAAGAVSARIPALVEGTLTTMFITKLKAGGLGLLMMGAIAAGTVVLAQQAPGGRGEPSPPRTVGPSAGPRSYADSELVPVGPPVERVARQNRRTAPPASRPTAPEASIAEQMDRRIGELTEEVTSLTRRLRQAQAELARLRNSRKALSAPVAGGDGEEIAAVDDGPIGRDAPLAPVIYPGHAQNPGPPGEGPPSAPAVVTIPARDSLGIEGPPGAVVAPPGPPGEGPPLAPGGVGAPTEGPALAPGGVGAPTTDRSPSEASPPGPGQEQRLKALEEKLDKILKKLGGDIDAVPNASA